MAIGCPISHPRSLHFRSWQRNPSMFNPAHLRSKGQGKHHEGTQAKAASTAACQLSPWAKSVGPASQILRQTHTSPSHAPLPQEPAPGWATFCPALPTAPLPDKKKHLTSCPKLLLPQHLLGHTVGPYVITQHTHSPHAVSPVATVVLIYLENTPLPSIFVNSHTTVRFNISYFKFFSSERHSPTQT